MEFEIISDISKISAEEEKPEEKGNGDGKYYFLTIIFLLIDKFSLFSNIFFFLII